MWDCMIRFLTAGESHGMSLTAILEGMPAGLPISIDKVNYELSRRQKGFGSSQRMKIEQDTVQITSGIFQGKTTGAPIALHICNKDYRSNSIEPLLTIPRPGHADFVAAKKYNYKNLRLALERASARETAIRTAVGAICRQYIEHFHIVLGGYVRQIGDVVLPIHKELHHNEYLQLFQQAEQNEFRCPEEQTAIQMKQAIEHAQQKGESLGGVITIFALNVPIGLGSHVHYDRKIDGQIGQAMFSIPSVKGIEIGSAFQNTLQYGSQVHDAFFYDEQKQIQRASNHAGGIEGGITNGQPIVIHLAIKPIPTLLQGMDSVDLATETNARTMYERSDICAVPRVVPIAESMLAIVLAQNFSTNDII